jgi:hypothetical protein
MRTKIFIFILFLFGFAYYEVQYTDFDAIRFRKNPSIKLSSGDTISNRTPGIIDMSGSSIKVQTIIQDTTIIPRNYWEVSPSYPLSIWRKTSPSISAALTNIDSGVIYVHPGIYTERITAKSNVAIVGDDPSRVIISRIDTAVVYAINCSNFSMKNITIFSNAGNASSTLIRIKNSWSDSTENSKIIFDNLVLKLYGSADIYGYAIYSDSASYTLTNSLIYGFNQGLEGYEEWINIYNKDGSNAYIENCRIINMVNVSSIVISCDNRCKLFMINSKIYNQWGGNIFNSNTAITRLIGNMSNDTLNIGTQVNVIYDNHNKNTGFFLKP